jgi:L-lactate utilization protein LutC
LEFIDQIETIDLTEETKSETLQDYAGPNKDFSALTIGNVHEVSEEEIKEETLRQEENIISDSYSASITVASEEEGLKEAEPENNEQVKSFDNKEISEEDQVGLGYKFYALKMTSSVYSSISTSVCFSLFFSFLFFHSPFLIGIEGIRDNIFKYKSKTSEHRETS